LPKGFLDPAAVMMPSAKPGPHPPRNLSLAGTGSLTLDGNRYRVETDRTVWSIAHGETRPSTSAVAFDGNKYVSLARRSPGATHPSAHIHPATHEAGELGQASLQPVFRVWRGADARFARSPLDLYEVSGRVVSVQSRPCVEVVRARRSSDQRHHLLLDRERGYVVVRDYVSQGSAVLSQTDIRYRADAVAGWVPEGWEWTSQSARGQAGESIRCEVTRVEVNAAQAADTFDPALEPGTYVVDTRGGGSETQYVVRADGRPGAEVPGTQPVSYDELAAEPRPVSVWWPVGVGVVGLAVVAAVIYRRRKPGG
jgi:hypothetical protein